MAGFNTAPTLVKVALILCLIGVVVDVIGFAIPYWRTYEGISMDIRSRRRIHYEFNEGLWEACSTYSGHAEICRSYGDMPSWFEATQAFETLGFIAALAALVLLVLYIFVPATSGKKIVFILSMLACFAAAGCIILGIIIYGSKVKDNLSWSFALCCIAGIIFGVSGILLIVDMLKR